MSDDADRADDRIEAYVTDGIANARRMLDKVRLSPCGNCHYCGEWVKAGVLFCNKDCTDDWHYEQTRLKAMGKK
jgi:hypothetical protein